jgi:hypothetical protein
VWWAALGVLLFNDNVLKGAGIVPGWLTGKLSDFAFLIVAPVLVGALLPRAVPRRRAIAMMAVVLVYAAADLSPAVSNAIVAAAHRVGLPWRLWPDVTDLMALAVLPLTWRLLRATADQAAPPAERSRPLMESAGVFAGALACLATAAPYYYEHAPYVVNQTAQPREITATWLRNPIPCDGDLADLAAHLTSRDLKDAHRDTLASGEVAVLDQPPPPGQPLRRTCPSREPTEPRPEGACTGVVVQAAADLAVLVEYPALWGAFQGDFLSCDDDSPATKCKAHFKLHENAGSDALSLQERGGKLAFVIGNSSQLRVAPIPPDRGLPAPPPPDAGPDTGGVPDGGREAGADTQIDTGQ